MDCTQALDCTQAYFDTSISDTDSPLVAGWIDILGTKHELEQGYTKLGRDPASCKIILGNEKTLSKEHAIFEVEGCHVTVCDLNSRNKSKLNQMYLKPHVRYALQGNEKLLFGDVSAMFIKAEKVEISDTDSETSLLPANLCSDSTDSVLVPETPTCYFRPKNKIVLESPMQESCDVISGRKIDKGDVYSNKGNQDIGIIRSVTKMPEMSDDDNSSDESTDIEDYLECYKVSQVLATDSNPADPSTVTSSGSDPAIPSTDDMKDNSSEELELFQRPTQAVSVGQPDKLDDIFNCPTQPFSVSNLNASTPRQIKRHSENQACIPAFADSPMPKVSPENSNDDGNASSMLTKCLEAQHDGAATGDVDASQSLIGECVPVEDRSTLNASEIRKINLFGYDSTEDFLRVAKLEPASQSDDSQEGNLPPGDDLFNAPTQMVGSTKKARSPVDDFDDSQPTQAVCPLVVTPARVDSTADVTQDIINVFNNERPSEQFAASNDDSTQSVLRAFGAEKRSPFIALDATCDAKRHVAVRNDPICGPVDDFDMATQPFAVATASDKKDTSTDDDDSIYMMPTQEFVTERSIFATKSKTPACSSEKTAACAVFDMPTQCFRASQSVTKTHDSRTTGELEAETDASADNSLFDAPTQKYPLASLADRPPQGIQVAENISVKSCHKVTQAVRDDNDAIFVAATQAVRDDDNAIFMAATQVFAKGNREAAAVTEPLGTTEDIYDAATQVIQLPAAVAPSPVRHECPDPSGDDVCSSAVSDEDTDIEDILERADDNSDQLIADEKRKAQKLRPRNVCDVASKEMHTNILAPPAVSLGVDAKCLSNSSFKSSCAPSIEMETLELSEMTTSLNNTPALQLVGSPGSDTDVGVSAEPEKCEPKSKNIIASVKRTRSVSGVKPAACEDAQHPPSSALDIVNKRDVCEINDDFSGFDSSPTKSDLNRSKTLVLRKTINNKSEYSSSSENEQISTKSSSGKKSRSNPKLKAVEKPKKVTSVKPQRKYPTKEAQTTRDPPARKRGRKTAEEVISMPSPDAAPAPNAGKRPSRRSKPPARYSPVCIVPEKTVVSGQLPARKPLVTVAVKSEPESPTKSLHRTLPLRNNRERSNTLESSQIISRGRSTRRNTVAVPFAPEVPQAHSTRRSSRVNRHNVSIAVKVEATERRTVLEPSDQSSINSNDKPKPVSSRTTGKRKTRSGLESEDNCATTVKCIKIEQPETVLPRTRGRSTRTKAAANTNKLWSVKESSESDEDCKLDIKKEPRQCSPVLSSATSISKRQTRRASNNVKEIDGRLKRKMTSRSASAEIVSPPCGRKRISRSSTASVSPVKKAPIPTLVCQTPKVLFTGFTDEGDEKIVKCLGGQLVDSVKDCSVLVTTALKRTCKLLAALGRGVTIACPLWLIESKKAGHFLDANSFAVSDKQAEEKFGFTLVNSLSQVRTQGPLFVGYSVHATKSVRPTPADVKEIVECAGGDYLKTAPKAYSDKVIIVSCPEDQRSWARFRKLKIPVVGVEFILSGLLHQKIEIDGNIL